MRDCYEVIRRRRSDRVYRAGFIDFQNNFRNLTFYWKFSDEIRTMIIRISVVVFVLWFFNLIFLVFLKLHARSTFNVGHWNSNNSITCTKETSTKQNIFTENFLNFHLKLLAWNCETSNFWYYGKQLEILEIISKNKTLWTFTK